MKEMMTTHVLPPRFMTLLFKQQQIQPLGGLRFTGGPTGVARLPATVAASSSRSNPSSSSSSSKRNASQELIEALLDENARLRKALATLQGCEPEEILLDAPSQLQSKGLDDDITKAEFLEALERGIQWPSEAVPEFWKAPQFRDAPLPLPPSLIPSQDNDDISHKSNSQSLYIVHITAELAPYAKVGGLGDVVTGLSKACSALGHRVEVILPFYECLNPDLIESMTLECEFDCPKGRTVDGNVLVVESLRTQVFAGRLAGCSVLLLRPDWSATKSPLFRGSRIYGGSYNETEAYLYFCRAALEFLTRTGRRPDVLHAHEWQSSAVPMMYWEYFAGGALHGSRPILTIHNMDNSGECRQDEFAATGFSGEAFATVDKALDERTIGHNPERLCLLKGGIVYSSAVTTVSPTYAQEVLTGGAAGWLRSTLARPEVGAKFWGVLNGIDTEEAWNPEIDALIPACYSSRVPEGKELCKRFLRRGFGLVLDDELTGRSRPLVAVISRLVPQKGIHLIERAVVRTVEQGGQFVLLGAGHADGGLRRLASEYASTGHVAMHFGYSETLAHLIYAAADIFLVPSMFEPCGLTQMIALRYGAVPVVRRTGGLADTVFDVDDGQSQGKLPPNGFTFDGTDAAALDGALDRALKMYCDNSGAWKELVVRNLEDGTRWSWKGPAASYLQLYAGVVGVVASY